MRSVQVVQEHTGDVTRADHVIGFDESGDISRDDAFALTAVRCPRDCSERLAEILIDCSLQPWRGKATRLAEQTSRDERQARVETLLDRLDSEPIEWTTAGSYASTSIYHKAAAVCILSQKTITRAQSYSGDAVIIPDGAPDMYGPNQRILRQQASHRFEGSFESSFGEVYVSALPKADLTYPEAATADYISAYIRTKMQRGVPPTDLPDGVVRFTEYWREPETSPSGFYTLRRASGDHGPPERRRIIAWLRGRHPEGDEFDASAQYENVVEQMVESSTVKEYLLDL